MRTFIFKNEVYNTVNNPALKDLPILPGPPEYAVYSDKSGVLRGHVAEVLLCEELEPGRHYRYVLRDLMPEFRRPRGDEDLVRIAARVGELHGSLRSAWPGDRGRLLHYRDGSVESFLRYFSGGLRRHIAASSDDPVARLLAKWDRVERLYASDEFHDASLMGPIHGDPNSSNVHLHRADPSSMRFVDWEWCGVHLGHADLASLLKGASPEGEAAAVARYASVRTEIPPAEHERLYHWCRFERGLIDAAFLTMLRDETPGDASFDLAAFVRSAAARSLRSAERLWSSTLTGTGVRQLE